jgi:hypothetical protein
MPVTLICRGQWQSIWRVSRETSRQNTTVDNHSLLLNRLMTTIVVIVVASQSQARCHYGWFPAWIRFAPTLDNDRVVGVDRCTWPCCLHIAACDRLHTNDVLSRHVTFIFVLVNIELKCEHLSTMNSFVNCSLMILWLDLHDVNVTNEVMSCPAWHVYSSKTLLWISLVLFVAYDNNKTNIQQWALNHYRTVSTIRCLWNNASITLVSSVERHLDLSTCSRHENKSSFELKISDTRFVCMLVLVVEPYDNE